jgi:hypothetical protein
MSYTVKRRGIPYASATSGENARTETIKILRRLGCESIGFMDEFDKHEVLLAFTHRGRPVQLRVSAKGWAQMYLKQNPYNGYRRRSRVDYEQDALRQGHVAVNSILRDWVKAQVTAIESGVLSFEAVFMPHMLTSDGRPLIERARDLLPEAAGQKVGSLPSPAA